MDYTGLLSELTKPAFSNTIIQVAGDRADEKIVSPTVSETDQADRAIPLLREVDNNNFNQLKVSDPDLDQHVGKKIQLEGQVQSVSLTYANNAANIIFQFKPQNNAPMIWISKTVYKNMMDKGVDPQNLEGKFIGARGVLGNYGGRTEEWKNRLQLTLESAEEIGVIDPK